MLRREFLFGTAAALVVAGCGDDPPPIQPTPPPQPTPTPTPTPNPVAPPTLKITRILSFGDSMTSGTTSPVAVFRGLDAGLPQSYPNKLQGMLTSRYSAQTITVLNGGIAGKQVVADNERDRLSRLLRDNNPELVILLEGANDINNITTGVNASLDMIAAGMEDMVRDSQARGIPVFIATLPEQRPGQKNTQNYQLVPRYNANIKTLAQRKNATLVDINTQIPLSLIGQDGLHPTEAGYEKFGEIFLDAIRLQFEVAPGLGRSALR
jgi:lysophospholipase L1-like esterase